MLPLFFFTFFLSLLLHPLIIQLLTIQLLGNWDFRLFACASDVLYRVLSYRRNSYMRDCSCLIVAFINQPINLSSFVLTLFI